MVSIFYLYFIQTNVEAGTIKPKLGLCTFFSAQSSTVITVNQGVRGGKMVELKKTVDEAVQSCSAVQQVFVARRTENPVTMTARDVALDEVRWSEVGEDFCPLTLNKSFLHAGDAEGGRGV